LTSTQNYNDKKWFDRSLNRGAANKNTLLRLRPTLKRGGQKKDLALRCEERRGDSKPLKGKGRGVG